MSVAGVCAGGGSSRGGATMQSVVRINPAIKPHSAEPRAILRTPYRGK